MATFKDYGRRLVINIVDEMACDEPENVVYSVALSHDISKGLRDINARDFANAVNRTAWWLESELGKGSLFPTVGYFGPRNDFRYILLIFGCIKAGYKVLLPSPRNSIEATVAVLNASKCDIWVSPKEQPEMLPQLLSHRSMKVIEIPDTDELLSVEPVPDHPYNKTFQEAADDPFCVLHTSGSTGLPKPIVWKNSLLGTLDATRLLPKSDGRPPWTVIFDEGDRFYSAFPLYHAAGLIMNVLIRAFYRTSNVIGPVGVLSTVNLVESLIDHTNIKVWSIIPSIVDEIGETPGISAKFASSKIIIASGGPVTYASANKATKDVRIFNLTGTSEGLFQGSLLVEREDWIYFSFHAYAGFDFRKIDEGVHEHWAVRNEERVALHQGIFHTFPDTKELTFKDLYAPHPTKSDLWIYRGRTDDMLVLSNGEKVRPVAMEAIINSHPLVSACLIVGTGYTMTSLLVELAVPEPSSTAEHEAILDSIMEKVHAANTVGSKQARLFREYIWFTKPGKPFVRTDKNTVKRRDTVLSYEREIEQFYKSMEEDGNLAAEIEVTSIATISQSVRQILLSALPAAKEISPDVDLLTAGVDSLVAFSISNSLRSALGKHNVSEETKRAVTSKFVYTHPSINALTKALYNLAHNKPGDSVETSVDLQRKSMAKLRAKYTAGLGEGHTVILTGSTGSLGSYLLESLLHQHQRVKKIYCLNRTEDGNAKQTAASESRGLTTDWPPQRVEFMQVDMSKPNFGLAEETYNTLLEQTTHIIHNQWPVNYNWDIASFEPHIRGVRHLIDFSLSSNHKASLFFVSSIATVSHLRSDDAIPEKSNHILSTRLDGYGSAKHVSELILEDAVALSGVNASICRVGQIAGPVLRGPEKGMWGKHEWVPTMIASSKYLGVLPSTLGSLSKVDWIPVDLLADILVQLSGATSNSTHGFVGIDSVGAASKSATNTFPVYHAVNPNAVEWASLVPIVAKHLGQSVKIVSWAEWVDALRNSRSTATAVLSLAQNPALKLFDFFDSLAKAGEKGEEWPVLETKETLKRSPRLAEVKPVSEEWMKLWLDQWKF
ncbi:Male sterility NAD-binding [Penicillium odoratum]|uniref:Male sterility NAD-binding n=1 Tax=Penicillium odoratum TaxID=1167516 RepID=UPI0025475CDA|nr:Male sterility NAD-binding [Penicillium odoratum]KAJ5746276.1 Male sterility NAD-binding [Penicillium odoratum]